MSTMKKLSLINLYKAEIKKNMMAQIKGGGDVKCLCSINTTPYSNAKESGGSISGICTCLETIIASSTVQNKPKPD